MVQFNHDATFGPECGLKRQLPLIMDTGAVFVFEMLKNQSHHLLCLVWCGDWTPGSAVNLPLPSPTRAKNTLYRYYSATQNT